MKTLESLIDMIDFTPELFLVVGLVSAVVLFCVGVLGWTDYDKNEP